MTDRPAADRRHGTTRQLRSIGLRPIGLLERAELLAQDLPPLWRGPIIGPGIQAWPQSGNSKRKIDLTGLPDPFPVELAWMAHWQETVDGTPASVQPINQLAIMLRRAIAQHREIPPSIHAMDAEAADCLLGWFYANRWGRLPPLNTRSRLRALFRLARLALVARCHQGPWWELDEWHPRCDPRIPLGPREPNRTAQITPGRITQPWLRAAVKWHLGMQLQAGTLRWSSVGQNRLLIRFDRWISQNFADARAVLGDPGAAPAQAAAFRRWASDPANRTDELHRRRASVEPAQVNRDLHAIAELFAFISDHPVDARTALGLSLSMPWDRVTAAHAASWSRQVIRTRRPPTLNAQHYVDDHALTQIIAALPLLGLPRSQQMLITRGDGTQRMAHGFGDPQAMRMILLQILTGRRLSEIRTCEFDCLSPAPDRPTSISVSSPAGTAPDGASAPSAALGAEAEVVVFRYAQSKIDNAPDTILVDQEVAAVIEQQRQWIREHLNGREPRFLFEQRISNLAGTKPYAAGTYGRWLREFSEVVAITDSAGRAVGLSRTHRFRHSKLTRLAELGLPIRVLQRYAGHSTPTMSMHYVAQREEHAEQAFLATVKLRADGTRVQFSREDHDNLHLFDRADRFLPHGWCLLPPLQSCDKGNGCLTCSVFVTDDSHQQTLHRQLSETTALIERTTTAFQQRHGRPMPADNVWLAQRHAEHAALTQLLASMNGNNPGRAIQGGGCGAAPAGPVPLTLELTRPRRTSP